MATKPITLILGIVHSKLAQNVAPQLLDESLANQFTPALDKITEGIQDLKIKDLKLSQDQLEFIMVRLKNKYGKKKGCSEGISEKLSKEIDADLKSTQLSAMSGLNSGLGSVEKVDCIKIILMTECFMVLNTLSSLKEIKPHEKDILVAKLANAEQSCDIKLRQLNDIVEVRDYLTKKLFPGNNKKLTMDNQRFGIGINKAKLTNDVITINFYVNMFFHHFHKKIAAYEVEEAAKTKKKKKKKLTDKEEGDDVNEGMIDHFFEGGFGSTSFDSETKVPLLDEDVLCVGAAYSVVTNDNKLAQHVENFMLRFDELKQRTAEMNRVKDYLRNNAGVLMASKRSRKAMKKEMKSDDIKDHQGGALKYLNMLATMQSMSDYVVDTGKKEIKPRSRLRKPRKQTSKSLDDGQTSQTNLVHALEFARRLRGRLSFRRGRSSVKLGIVETDSTDAIERT